MKTQKNALVFKKSSILELNDSQLYSVNGGTGDTIDLTVYSISLFPIIPIPVPVPVSFLSIIIINP